MLSALISWLPILVIFAFAAYLVWMAISKVRSGQRQHADVQKEIVSKFSSGEELRAFLKSEEGKELFRNFDSEGLPRRSLRERAVSRIGIGIVLMIVGGGLLILAHYADQPQVMTSYLVQPPPPGTPGVPAPPPVPSSEFVSLPPGMGFPAAVLLLTGFGMIVSSVVTLKLHATEASKP